MMRKTWFGHLIWFDLFDLLEPHVPVVTRGRLVSLVSTVPAEVVLIATHHRHWRDLIFGNHLQLRLLLRDPLFLTSTPFLLPRRRLCNIYSSQKFISITASPKLLSLLMSRFHTQTLALRHWKTSAEHIRTHRLNSTNSDELSVGMPKPLMKDPNNLYPLKLILISGQRKNDQEKNSKQGKRRSQLNLPQMLWD